MPLQAKLQSVRWYRGAGKGDIFESMCHPRSLHVEVEASVWRLYVRGECELDGAGAERTSAFDDHVGTNHRSSKAELTPPASLTSAPSTSASSSSGKYLQEQRVIISALLCLTRNMASLVTQKHKRTCP